MKKLMTLALLSGALISHAQTTPILKSKTKYATIIEGNEERQKWLLNPKDKLQDYSISKSPKGKWVRFITDTDSIKKLLKPGEKLAFRVVIADKDTCRISIESPQIKNYANQKPVQHDTIPFVLTDYNNIKFKAVLNRRDSLDLKFDSGTTGLLLTHDAIKEKTHNLDPDKAENHLQIGSLNWSNLEVFPVAISGQGTDGRFGWDLFDGKVVEIDYDKNLMIVHTRMPELGKGYSKFPIEYTHTLFCINGELQIKDQKFKNRFLFDNGYQRTIMMDTLLMHEQNYPKDLEVIKKVVMKNGQGKEIPVYTVNNERLNLGKNILYDIPVQLLATANPARFKTHIMGNEVLKRFNTILDFQKNYVYLKPNSLFNMPYTDARKKNG
ncbi:hypothetical protein [Emticicia fontis]